MCLHALLRQTLHAEHLTFQLLLYYLSQTPVSAYLGKEASLKMVANIKEAGDSLLQVFKPYTRECIMQQLGRNNFEFITMDIVSGEENPAVEIEFYASVMQQLPVPKEREDGVQMSFEIDSTINLPQGPFEVRDVAKKSKAYLEQLPNMRLRYMDANKKGKEKGEKKSGGFEVDLKADGGLMQMMGGFTVLRLSSMMGMMNISFTKEELLKLNKQLNRIRKPKKLKK